MSKPSKQDKQSKQLITTGEILSDFNQWLEVASYSVYVDEEKAQELYKEAQELTKGSPDWVRLLERLTELSTWDYWDLATETFLRFVEAHFKTRVKDGDHLEELTGKTEQDYKTPKGMSPYIKNGLDSLVTTAQDLRYKTYLAYVLAETQSYKEIAQIKPSSFNLPDKWLSKFRETWEDPETKETTLWAVIGEAYRLWEFTGLYRPSLREVAQHIGAPYSVILGAYRDLYDYTLERKL